MTNQGGQEELKYDFSTNATCQKKLAVGDEVVSSSDKSVYDEQVCLLYKPFNLTVIATVFAATLFVMAQWYVVDRDVLISWFIIIVGITLSRGILAYRFSKQASGKIEYEKWGRYFIVGAAVSGIIWGVGGVLLFPENEVAHQVIVAFVIIGICTGAVTSLSVVRSALLIFLASAMLPIIPLFFLEGGYVSYVISAMLILSFIFFYQGSRTINNYTVDNIKLRLNSIENEKALHASKLQLEEANNAKSQFLTYTSHELRTPLNAILGYAQLLEIDSNEFTETQNIHIREIVSAGDHLLLLTNDLLDLAKIESGKLEVSLSDVCLSDVMKDCIPMIKPLADKKEIIIINNIKDNNLFINADYTRLTQVFINLLSNAIKYNDECGKVTVSSRITGEEKIKIDIADTGKGIPEDKIEHIFDLFVRLDKQEKIEGAGIGLVVTKNLVELMGGYHECKKHRR